MNQWSDVPQTIIDSKNPSLQFCNWLTSHCVCCYYYPCTIWLSIFIITTTTAKALPYWYSISLVHNYPAVALYCTLEENNILLITDHREITIVIRLVKRPTHLSLSSHRLWLFLCDQHTYTTSPNSHRCTTMHWLHTLAWPCCYALPNTVPQFYSNK